MKDDTKEIDIIYSKTIKAGKRIYYLDVKKDRKDEMFLTITESKKVVNGTEESPIVQFEKHKIFLYQKDFDKLLDGLHEVIEYIKQRQPYAEENGYAATEEKSYFDSFLDDLEK